MDHKFKYLVGEIGEKANELWEQYPDVMEAVGKESVEAWKNGFKTGMRKGFTQTCVPAMAITALVGGVVFAVRKIKQHKETKKIEYAFEEFN